MLPIVYTEFRPHEALSPYIDAFWTLSGNNTTNWPDKIMPDGCVDIIFNSGPAFSTRNGAAPMATGEAYLVGTMTRYIELVRPPATQLTGIRFKPGGFTFFYDPSFLRNAADRTVEFDRALIPAINSAFPDNPASRNPASVSPGPAPDYYNPASALDAFFLRRLKAPVQPIQPLIANIQQAKGNLTVSRLARQNFMTIRRLERLFHLHLAISPKEFINFVRYQSAIQQIRVKAANRTFFDIAFECGYYDHAHLTNEIKKYTGSIPSTL